MATEIAELPTLPCAPTTPGDPDFAGFCRALFAAPSRLLRLEDCPVVFRNEDLRTLAAHPQVGQSPPALIDRRSFTLTAPDGQAVFAASLSRLIGHQFFTANPPVHKPVRHVLAPHFMPVSVAAMEPLAMRLAAELARELSQTGAFEFCSRFAARFAARFFGELIGMTAAEEARVAALMTALSPMFLLHKSIPQLRTADDAAREYLELIEGVAERTLRAGDHALLNQMAQELATLDVSSDPERAGRVPDSLGLMLASNLLDGFHTTGVGASSAVYLLLEHPQERERLRAEPTLARVAVQEALRLYSPLTVTQRFALAEVQYADVRISAGTPLIMLWAVGNRDPAAFADPDRFLLSRHHRHATTFGGGVHVCPGRYVADMMARAVIREVMGGSWHMSLEPEGVAWETGSMLCQLAALPVRLAPAQGIAAPPQGPAIPAQGSSG